MAQPYWNIGDLSGTRYCRFMAELLDREDWFGLIVYDLDLYTWTCESLVERLAPFLIKEWRVAVWPGTDSSQTNTMRTYHATMEVHDLVTEPGSLFKWGAPNYPEDLFFGRDRGDMALISTSHERLAYVFREEYVRLLEGSAGGFTRLADGEMSLSEFSYLPGPG